MICQQADFGLRKNDTSLRNFLLCRTDTVDDFLLDEFAFTSILES